MPTEALHRLRIILASIQCIYLQVYPERQTPLAHGGGEVSGPHRCHPYTMPVSLPPCHPTIQKIDEMIQYFPVKKHTFLNGNQELNDTEISMGQLHS